MYASSLLENGSTDWLISFSSVRNFQNKFTRRQTSAVGNPTSFDVVNLYVFSNENFENLVDKPPAVANRRNKLSKAVSLRRVVRSAWKHVTEQVRLLTLNTFWFGDRFLINS